MQLNVWFYSGIKKQFTNIKDYSTKDGWMMLIKADNKQILINANNVNFVEEV